MAAPPCGCWILKVGGGGRDVKSGGWTGRRADGQTDEVSESQAVRPHVSLLGGSFDIGRRRALRIFLVRRPGVPTHPPRGGGGLSRTSRDRPARPGSPGRYPGSARTRGGPAWQHLRRCSPELTELPVEFAR